MQTRHVLSPLATIIKLLMTGFGWVHGSTIQFICHFSVVDFMMVRSSSENFFLYLAPNTAGSSEIVVIENSDKFDGVLISDKSVANAS